MHTLIRLALAASLALTGSAAFGDTTDVKTIRGNHPHAKGMLDQYFGLGTALRGHIYFADVITPESRFTTFDGKPIPLHGKENETADNYADAHNHYQNLLVSTVNRVPNVNAVSIWGDSHALADGAKAWGGFLSARSSCSTYAKGGPLNQYAPELQGCGPERDNQLIGLEIDVLNESKPGVYPNMSKTGLQVVGFGHPNSMAMEVRSEDSDRKYTGAPAGAFESIVYVKNAIQPEYGRLIVADFDKASIGLDFRRALFTEGLLRGRSTGVGTGLILNDGNSGEMYGGRRWGEDFQDERGWLTLRAGTGGLRVVSHDNRKEILAVDNDGGIYLNGDLFVNQAAGELGGTSRSLLVLVALATLLNLGLVLYNRRLVKRIATGR